MSNTSASEPREHLPSGRRKFLKVLGGGFILAAVGGGIFAATRTPHKALEPWKLALGPSAEIDPRRIILSHAILAPNPHNRQPWLVDLTTDKEIVLYCDLDRRLPHTDPYDRQITIGLGCFLELAVLTAKHIGMNAEIKLFPEGEGTPRLNERPVARITLSAGQVERDPLFDQLFERRSNKDPFDTGKTVPQALATQILQASGISSVGSVLDGKQIDGLRKITWEALDTEMRTYRTSKESIDLMRIGKAEIEANPDGIDLGGAFLESLSVIGVLSREKMLTLDETQLSQMQGAVRPAVDTAMGYVFVKTEGNSRRDQIAAGRAYVRMNLKATELGIAMHPLSQSLQEFEEVAPQYNEIREVLGIEASETLQMFARIGYGEKPQPSPRWGYETRIRDI